MSSYNPAWTITRPRSHASLVLISRDLLHHILKRNPSSTREFNVKQEEVTCLKNHAKLALQGMGWCEDVVSVQLGGTRSLPKLAISTMHGMKDAKLLEIRQLRIRAGVDSSCKGGDAEVANEGVRIVPLLLEVQDTLRATPDKVLEATAAKGRTAVLPNALGDERILLMDGVLTMSSEPVDDDLGVRLGCSQGKPGGVLQTGRDGRIVN